MQVLIQSLLRMRTVFSVLLLLFFQALVAQEGPGLSRRVTCSADTTEQYALYLPTHYAPEKMSPLLLFLDPGARGSFPVNKYQSLAERYGIIMAGSFNSRNFNGASSEHAFIAIYNDLVNKYSIDPGMIWISGFSGGSRAAAALAMAYPAIQGVIGCGAGFADMEESSLKKLKAYVAVTGDRDMNFGELLDNHEQLERMGVNDLLLQFDGGHEWPPLPQMELALSWLIDNKTPLNDNILERVSAKADSGILYAALLEAEQLMKISAVKEKAILLVSAIKQKPGLTADQILFEQVMEEERKSINEFALAFGQLLSGGPFEEENWTSKAGKIAQWEKDKNRYRQLSGQRCYNQAIATCQEYYFQFMNTGNYSKALNAANVFLCFDPQNPNGYYMLARAEAGLGNKKRTVKDLNESVKRGLTWNSRIENDPLLLQLFSIEELKKIVVKN